MPLLTLAAAGPSPTPLILELALAVVVLGAIALRRPVGRLLAAWRAKLAGVKPGRAHARATARARAR
jgi:hypothetical protein